MKHVSHRTIIRLSTLALLGSLSIASKAQEDPFAFRPYTVVEGMPGDGVLAIDQDLDGFMWVGSETGMARFDGYNFEIFTSNPDDSSSISSNRVFSFAARPDGQMWVGTMDAGLNLFDPRTEMAQRFPADTSGSDVLTGPSDNYITALHRLEDGRLLIGSNAGVDVYEDERFRALPLPVDNDMPVVSAFLEADDSSLWISSYAGLFRIDRRSLEIWRPEHVAAADSLSINSIALDDASTLWLATLDGLFSLPAGSDQLVSHAQVTASQSQWANRSYSVAVDDDNRVWLGTIGGDVDDGLHLYDPENGQFRRFRSDRDDPNSLPGNRILRIFTDDTGLLWVGTRYGGLAMVDPEGSDFAFHGRDGLYAGIGTEIFTVASTDEGDLLTGTWNGGLSWTRPFSDASTLWSNAATSSPRLSGVDVLSIFVDGDDSIWTSSFDGLDHISRSGRILERYSTTSSPALPSDWVSAVSRAPDGSLWVGMWSHGIAVLRPGASSFERLTHDSSDSETVPSDNIRQIYPSHDGRMWVRTDDHLAAYDLRTGSFSTFSQRGVTSAAIERDGAVWIGTAQNGVAFVDRAGNEKNPFTVEHGLPHASVSGVQLDSAGRLWIVTARGLASLDPDSKTITQHHTEPMLRPNKMGWSASTLMPDGQIVFAGGNGYLAFDPAQVAPDANPPEVRFTAIKKGAEEAIPYSGDQGLSFSHAENDVRFDFVGLSYRDPERTVYETRLLPASEHWQAPSDSRSVNFVNLQAGTYTLEVRAANTDGVFAPTAAAVSFTIRPPWWRTGWAFVLYVMLLVGGAFAAVRARTLRLETRAHELEQQVQERTGELKQQTTRLEESNMVIAGQAERLEELNRMKSRFFANISHEFRTPLTLILGPVRDALSGTFGAVEPVLDRQLRAMERNGSRLLHLINQLLDLAKMESGTVALRARKTDVAPVIRRLVMSFSSLAERRGIQLSLEAGFESNEDVMLDEDRFEQIVNNLLSNALKFTGKDGSVRVRTAAVETGGREHLEVIVTDSGPGLSKKELKHVFERFQQGALGASMPVGSGVGLALVKEWAELHGGSVMAESTPGVGSTFTVRLPVGSEHLDPADIVQDLAVEDVITGSESIQDFEPFMDHPDETEPLPAPANEDRPLVLLVEDNPDVRTYIRDLLSARYTVREAANGREGLELAESLKPSLVISDVMMPDMDGYALCAAIKKRDELGLTPVILLTAKAEEESKLEGLQAGADDYLFKPFNSSELLVRAENLIEIRQRLRSRMSEGVVRVKTSEVIVSSADEVLMERVRLAVEEHIDNSNFGTEWLADEIGLSTRQLRRKIKECTNLTTSGYIRTLRLERAAQLLEQNAGTVSEIAYAVGFQDPKHFSRLFRQIYGEVPSKYADSAG